MEPAGNEKPRRRVHGHHDRRMDGLHDLVARAPGMSVLDVGMNRGANLFEMMDAGARLVNGMELDHICVDFARTLWADLDETECRWQFEVGDLTKGISCLDPFGPGNWDIVLMIGVYHKIKRLPSSPYRDLGATPMDQNQLNDLIRSLGRRADKYLAFRVGPEEHEHFDPVLAEVGMRKIAVSEISKLGPTVIYRREG